MRYLLLICSLVAGGLFFAGCSNSNQSNSEADEIDTLGILHSAIDTLTWQEVYSYQSKGNKTLDNITLSKPYRIKYRYVGDDEDSFIIYQENDADGFSPLVIGTAPGNAFKVGYSPLDSINLKVVTKSSWVLAMENLPYRRPAIIDSLINSSHGYLVALEDSLLRSRVAALDTSAPISYEAQESAMKSWVVIANSNSLWHDVPFHHFGGIVRVRGEYDVPNEQWYIDYLGRADGANIVIRNMATGKKYTILGKLKVGRHPISVDLDLPAGDYIEDDFEMTGDFYFTLSAFK